MTTDVQVAQTPAEAEPGQEPHTESGAGEGGLDFQRPELPEGLAYDEGLEANFRETAQALNLSTEQSQGLVDAFAAYQAQSFETLDANAQPDTRAVESELRGEWGEHYDANLDAARRAASAFADDDATMEALGQAMGDAGVVRFFHKLGSLMAEDTLAGSGESGFGLSPQGARSEIGKIETQLAGLLSRHDAASQRERQTLEARRRDLLQRAYS